MPKISRSQAEFNFISKLIDEQETLRKKQNEIRRREEKKARRSGTGSIIGALLGAFLTPFTGGASIGIGAGIGSRIGSEVGERTVKGTSQIDPDDFLFGISDIKQRNVEQKELDREFGRGQTMDAIFKGLLASQFAPEIGRTKDVGRSLFEGSKRFGSLKEMGKYIGSGKLPVGLQKSQEALGVSGGFGLGQQTSQFGKGFQPDFTGAKDPFFFKQGTTARTTPLQDTLGFDYGKFNKAGQKLTGQNQDILSLFKNKTPDEIIALLEQPRGVRRVFDNDIEELMRMLEEMLGRPKGQEAVQRTQSLLGTQGGFGITNPSIKTPNFRI